MSQALRIQSSAPQSVRGLDAYFTPPVATWSLVRLEAAQIPGRIWEPAAGDGAMSRVLIEAGYDVVSSDIGDYGFCRSDVDYLKAPASNFAQAIVTNPPFSLAAKFAEKAISEVDYVALLLRTNFLESVGRLPFFRRHPPTRIWLSSRRFPMMHRHGWTGKRSTSNTPHAWFIWERGAERQAVDWFDWQELLPRNPILNSG